MQKQYLIIAIVAVVVLGGGYYFYSMGSPSAYPSSYTPPTPSSADTSTTPPPTADTTSMGAEKDFTVTGKNFSFSPSTLSVKKGDTVKITFKNAGGMHDFKIDEFNVATSRINDGQEATVTFVADKAGTFNYYCSVGTHRSMGMQGTLTVTE